MKKIFIAGHKGMVGSAIYRKLQNKPNRIVIADKRKLNLLDQKSVLSFFKRNKFDEMYLCAAKVGGIHANTTYVADFIYQNLEIQNNFIHSAYLTKVKKLMFLGSSCVYPKKPKIPIKEEYLLTSELENTNEMYAIAKIAGLKMCEAYNKQYGTNYKCLMPANAYGPNDSYHLMNSHFFPALIKKAHLCKVKKKKYISVWGTGKPYRELIYVDDLADACIYFMNKKIKDTLINIGTGKDKTIKQYALFVLKKLKLNIKIKFNLSKPDGVKRKLLDTKKAKKYGWKAKTSLSEGFDLTYKSFIDSHK